jgi:hypothetical protein
VEYNSVWALAPLLAKADLYSYPRLATRAGSQTRDGCVQGKMWDSLSLAMEGQEWVALRN